MDSAVGSPLPPVDGAIAELGTAVAVGTVTACAGVAVGEGVFVCAGIGVEVGGGVALLGLTGRLVLYPLFSPPTLEALALRVINGFAAMDEANDW